MFNKKVLASSLIALALSLGAQAGKGLKSEQKSCGQAQQSQQAQQAEQNLCDQSKQVVNACDQSQQAKQVVVNACDQSQQAQQVSQCADQSQVAAQCSQMSQQAAPCAQSAQSQCGTILVADACTHDWQPSSHFGASFSHYRVHNHTWNGKRISGKFKHQISLTLTHNHFHDTKFKRLTFEKMTWDNNHWNGHMHKVAFVDSRISNCNMMGTLNGVSFSRTHISNTSFRGAHFGLASGHVHSVNTKFDGAILENVNFAGAYIGQGVSFRGAQLGPNVNFVGAYIEVAPRQFQIVTVEMANHIHGGFSTLATKGVDLATFLVDGGFATASAAGHLVLGAANAVVGGISAGATAATHELHSASHLALDHIRALFNNRGSYTETTVISANSCNTNLGCH